MSSHQQRWDAFCDAVLARAVARRRARWGQGFDPAAGSTVGDADLDRLLASLPSADTTPAGEAAAIGAALGDPDADDALAWIAAAADLDAGSTQVLALAVGIAWSPVRQQLLGYVQDDLTVRGLMVSSIPTLLDLPADAARLVAPDAPLRRSCVVDVRDERMVGTGIVEVAPAVLWYTIGDESRDPALPDGAVVYPGDPVAAPGRWLVHGPDRVRRLQAAARLVGSTRLLVTPEPSTPAEWAAVVRTAVCRATAVVLDVPTLGAAAAGWIARAPTIPWVISSRHQMSLHEVPDLRFVEQRADEGTASDDEVAELLGAVSPGHRLTAEQLQLLGRIDGIDPHESVRRLATGELERLANRIHPRYTWDDLVLTPDRMAKVREVATRVVHHRTVYGDWGFPAVPADGVVALFAGPPGTGKTMAAEVLAGELGLDMFKVNLANVVSKYIGETEKELERLFDAAEGGGVLLVFDEADALFGKRTAVDDSKDRYANIETSYLLQRVESYRGVTILTTNLASNIDEAFVRRITVSVEFAIPEPAERLRIWQGAIPKSAPVDRDVDLAFVAERIPVAGSVIRSATLNAAFVAAAAGSPIGMRHIVLGLRREYQKLGKLITPTEFGPWFDVAAGNDVDPPDAS